MNTEIVGKTFTFHNHLAIKQSIEILIKLPALLFLFVSFPIFFTRWQHISQIRYDLSTRLSDNILSTLLPNDILSGCLLQLFVVKLLSKY